MNNIDYEDYFFTKYSSDLSDLFLNIKNISNSFCINIFNNSYQQKNGCNNLQEFLFDNIIFNDEINDGEENNDDITDDFYIDDYNL